MNRPPQQQVLAIKAASQPVFDNFIPGDNQELLQSLQQLEAGFRGMWLMGGRGSGRTHLLQATCHRAVASGHRGVFIAVKDVRLRPQETLRALQVATEMGHVVALDDIAWLSSSSNPTEDEDCLPRLAESYLSEAQDLILGVYQRMLAEGGLLLISHHQPASEMAFLRADLASRMSSLAHYKLSPLKDDEKKALLRQRVVELGYTLDEAVLSYWFTHGPRSIGALLHDLDVLDTASLSRKNPVTIPLLKQVLNY